MIPPVVVDASAMVNFLGRDREGYAVRQVIDGRDLVAPALIDVEVLSALARMERARTLTSAEAHAAVIKWRKVAIDRMSIQVLTPLAWAWRHSIRITDAYYLAVASLLNAPLITSDARLARAPHPGVTVTLVQ